MYRLDKILSLSDPVHTMADIGTDHGFVPYLFLKENLAQKAIAIDISEPSLNKAKELLKNLQKDYDCRLGDGLKALKKEECQAIIIAGMGGALISKILEEGLDIAKDCQYLIVQPMQGVDILRENLARLGFFIEKEELAFERGKYYHLFKIFYCPKRSLEPQGISRAFLANNDPLKESWFQFEIKRREKVLENLNKAKNFERQKDKAEKVRKEIEKLKEWSHASC